MISLNLLLLALSAAQPQPEAAVVKVVPLTAVYKRYDAAGRPKSPSWRMFSANGSLRDALGDQGERLVGILNTEDLTEISVNPKLGIHTAGPMRPERAASLKSKPADCEQSFRPIAGFRSVTCYDTGQEKFGYPVIRAVLLTTIPSTGTMKEEVTAIRELGWLVLSRLNYDPKGRLVSRDELSDLKLGEPAPELFRPPAGSRWTSLLDFFTAEAQADGMPMPPEQRIGLQKKMEMLEEESKKTGNYNWKK